MNSNFKSSLRAVLKHEGGYVNHPSDPGGATNKGITLATYRRYIDPHGTAADLRKLTEAQAAVVYKRQYWDAVLGSELPSGVDYAVFDFAVNSGPSRAVRFLQRALKVQADGRVGPETLRALKKVDHKKLINSYKDARLAFLKRLSTWPTFGRGWAKRVSDVRSKALSMAGGSWSPPSYSGGGLIGALIAFLKSLFKPRTNGANSPSSDRFTDRENR